MNNINDLIRQCPDDIAPQTAPGVWDVALNMIDIKKGNLLVAGAGRGGLSWILDQAGYNVTSLDLHPEHFNVPELKCEKSDLNESLAFNHELFDAVIAIEVFEHLENPWNFLREAMRVLKPGGDLIFSTPNVESLVSRISYFRNGLLPYFKEESFVGCYHVTPIFSWAVQRCCQTTNAKLIDIQYSRIDWPRNDDVPRYDGNQGLRRWLLDKLPLNRLSGEVTCYKVRKTIKEPEISIGTHYA